LDDYTLLVKLTYFSFTTLTTIGLGDFHPKGDVERVLCTYYMLFGVMLFSFISTNYIIVLTRLRYYNKPVGDEDLLNKFIFTLYKFNGDEPVSKNFESIIREFFEYRWKHDMNLSISNPVDLQLIA